MHNRLRAYFDRLSADPPQPVQLHVCHSTGPLGDITTAIARVWEEGDSARCRLCPPGCCSALDDICLITVKGEISLEAAPLFDASRLRCGNPPTEGGDR